MDKRIHMLLEDAENDLSKKEVLGILMHIIAGTYQLMDQSFYLCIPGICNEMHIGHAK